MSVVSLNRTVQGASDAMYEVFDQLHHDKGNCQFTISSYLSCMFARGHDYDIAKRVLNSEECAIMCKSYSIMRYINAADEAMIILTSTFDYTLIESL